MMSRLLIIVAGSTLALAGVAVGNDWTIVSEDAGVTAYVGASENYLTRGLPWDSDGSEECPPDGGDDDIRCEWLTDHIAGDMDHPRNGVVAAVLDGSAAQSAVLLSDEWSDPRNSGSIWWVDYDVHFVAVDASEMTTLRATSQYQHAGVTRLTLNLSGIAGTVRVRHRIAPRHFWTDTPETGDRWRIRLTLRRTSAGDPAMIWVDNIVVSEGGQIHYDESFPHACPADLDDNGSVDFADILAVLAAWGCKGACPEDLDDNGIVDFGDILVILAAWGPCFK